MCECEKTNLEHWSSDYWNHVISVNKNTLGKHAIQQHSTEERTVLEIILNWAEKTQFDQKCSISKLLQNDSSTKVQ